MPRRALRPLEETPMANVVRDPREHPEAIIPDLATNIADIKVRAHTFNFHSSVQHRQIPNPQPVYLLPQRQANLLGHSSPNSLARTLPLALKLDAQRPEETLRMPIKKRKQTRTR